MTTRTMATRRSALALAQSRQVADALRAANAGLAVEELHVVTQGDRITDRPLGEVGGKGLFVTEIEEALLDGRAHFAVHSMKDLPADLAPGLVVACVPRRESPWDLLVTSEGLSLDALPRGARVGTSSLRRTVMLRAVRPDLAISMLRGNVDTRLRRLRDGDFDAVVLAEAGVRRLGLDVRATRLEGALVPAVAQGALALECRADDAETRAILAPLHDAASAMETVAERAVMRALEGNCSVPMGARASWNAAAGRMRIDGFYATPDGIRWVSDAVEDDVRQEDFAVLLGERLARALRARLQATENA